MAGENYSAHARLLPYLEQQAIYNAINLSQGVRWGPGADNKAIDKASGGGQSMAQFTAITAQINTFLCPSDPNPGSSGRFIVGGYSKLVGASNYPINIGLNRRYNSWKTDGPTYVATNWDSALSNFVNMASFVDGTSNTIIFSEWVKGPGTGPKGKSGPGIVYQGPPSNYSKSLLPNLFAASYRDAQTCYSNTAPIPKWGWKGEWWIYGGTMVYSHVNMPNRRACFYGGGADRRGSYTMVNASSLHPGGVNALAADGSVKFIKSSINPYTWYGLATPNGGEVINAGAY